MQVKNYIKFLNTGKQRIFTGCAVHHPTICTVVSVLDKVVTHDPEA